MQSFGMGAGAWGFEMVMQGVTWVRQEVFGIAASCTSIRVVCFADQDDVWLEDKLESAISRMDKEQCMPCLYLVRRSWLMKKLNPY